MLNAAREAARQMAVADLTVVASWPLSFTVSVDGPGTQPAPNDEDARVQITVPLADAALTGVSGVFLSGNLMAVATFRAEG